MKSNKPQTPKNNPMIVEHNKAVYQSFVSE